MGDNPELVSTAAASACEDDAESALYPTNGGNSFCADRDMLNYSDIVQRSHGQGAIRPPLLREQDDPPDARGQK